MISGLADSLIFLASQGANAVIIPLFYLLMAFICFAYLGMLVLNLIF